MTATYDTGPIEATTVVLSRFRLDGGAMFGSVPKPLWGRQRPADERNRIELVARGLLLRRGDLSLLVDAGVGEKLSPKEADIFAVRSTPREALPFRWDRLTHLLPTHLHFDHGGGLTEWPGGDEARADKASRLTAPQARVILQKANWEVARSPGPRERASYLKENVEPLADADLELIDGDAEVLPGVRVRRSDGHTRGMQWVLVEKAGETIAFAADVVPTTTHLHLPYVMGYDMCVETLLGEKEQFLRTAVDEKWTVVFAHDPDVPAARLGRDERGRFRVEEVVPL